jgi:hypothetical protein
VNEPVNYRVRETGYRANYLLPVASISLITAAFGHWTQAGLPFACRVLFAFSIALQVAISQTYHDSPDDANAIVS